MVEPTKDHIHLRGYYTPKEDCILVYVREGSKTLLGFSQTGGRVPSDIGQCRGMLGSLRRITV